MHRMFFLVLLALVWCEKGGALIAHEVSGGRQRSRATFLARCALLQRPRSTDRAVSSLADDFDLPAYFSKKVAAVERALDESVPSSSCETAKIVESMRYSLLAGGKRVRPVMCIAACEMFGGTEAMAMPTAVAVEMIHTMSLIHDDLPSMDNDDLRRGKPTNHVVYGEDVAILAGDALLSTSFEHCARASVEARVPAERVVEVIRRLGEAVGAVGLAGGQVMDLECEAKSDVSLQELTWIHTHKTAKLLEVSVAAGAVLAGAPSHDVAKCETFANDIGLVKSPFFALSLQ